MERLSSQPQQDLVVPRRHPSCPQTFTFGGVVDIRFRGEDRREGYLARSRGEVEALTILWFQG
jgi:hypothetical protein